MSPDSPKSSALEYFDRLINRRDLSVCEELLSSSYIDHDAPEGTPPGPESTVAWVGCFLDDHPDLKVELHDVLAEDRKVSLRLEWRGTHAESGEPHRKSGIIILHFDRNGRIEERSSAYD